jgi:hypothetical protein
MVKINSKFEIDDTVYVVRGQMTPRSVKYGISGPFKVKKVIYDGGAEGLMYELQSESVPIRAHEDGMSKTLSGTHDIMMEMNKEWVK